MEKFTGQCCSYEHLTVLNRQPVELLEGGCYMSIFSLIWDKYIQEYSEYSAGYVG